MQALKFIFFAMLIFLFGQKSVAKKLSKQHTTNLIAYLQNGLQQNITAPLQHIYLFQGIRCSGCAVHYFHLITTSEAKNKTAKIFVQIGKSYQSNTDTIRMLPHTKYILDSLNTYQQYKLYFDKDMLLIVKQQRIKRYFLFDEKHIKSLRRYFKKQY